MDHSYPYIASLTREPFLFYEMRSTAKLMSEGIFDDAIVKEIVEQNLFQYPTEKSITRMAKACIKRLHALEDDSLVSAIASQPTDVAKQICLYALMKQSRLVWEFMLTVIGEKYRLRDTSFGKIDLNTFFMRLQEQNDTVASRSDTTITKLKQIIARVLVETEYLDNRGADHFIARIRTDYVHEQQARYRTAIADLEQRIANASTGERVKLNKKLTNLQAQDTEIRTYEEKIHHLADQMISIDLDDGVKKNYAIFQDVLAKIK